MQPTDIYVNRIKVYAKNRSGLLFFLWEFFRDMKDTKGHAKDDMISN